MITAEFSPREKWRRIVDRQRASGLSVAAFCRQTGFAASSLFAWKRRLSPPPSPSPSPAVPAFVEATVAADASSRRRPIEVRLRGGRRLAVRGGGFDRELLAALVSALEAIP